jgi:hypothetical protein
MNCATALVSVTAIGGSMVATNIASAAPTSVAVNCPASHFLDVSKSEGAGDAYPKPTLSVTCADTTFTVTSNGIPNYKFVQITPNPLRAQTLTYQITLNPEIASQPTSAAILGPVGVAVNGLPINGPMEATQPASEAYGDPVSNAILDSCMGHTSPSEYHYHALVVKCLSADGKTAQAGSASPILGYALDGFPIYGPYGCLDTACTQVVQFKSSWEKIGNPKTNAWNAFKYVQKDGTEYLDQCNGRIGPDGTYRYYATFTFPYVIGCFKGTPNLKGPGQGGQLGGQGGQPGPATGQPGRPPKLDLAAAAQKLGVTEQALRQALGTPPPDFDAAAKKLGVTKAALLTALGIPTNGPNGQDGTPPQSPGANGDGSSGCTLTETGEVVCNRQMQ